MLETDQSELSIDGKSVDLKEGIYFIPFENEYGEKFWLSLRKETALYNFTHEQLLKLQKVIQEKLRELMIVRFKTQIQEDQIDVIVRYQKKLKLRINELEDCGKVNVSEYEPNPLRERWVELKRKLFG